MPPDMPEFAWITPQQAPELFTWQDRLVSTIRQYTLHDPMVAMAPVSHAGTVYRHPICNWLKFGGKHISPVTTWLDHWTRDWNQAFLFIMVLMLALALSIIYAAALCDMISYVWNVANYVLAYNALVRRYGWLQDVPMVGGIAFRLVKWWSVQAPTLTTPAVMLVWLQALAVVFGIVGARAIAYSSRDPGLFTTHTLSFIHRTSLGQEGGDPIVDILELHIGNPRQLEPFSFGTVAVQPELFRQALSILLSSDGMERASGRTVASLLRRYHYSVARTQASVNSALQIAQRMRSGDDQANGSGPLSPPVRSSRLQSVLAGLRVNVWHRVVAFLLIKSLVIYALVKFFLPAAEPSWWASLSSGVGW